MGYSPGAAAKMVSEFETGKRMPPPDKIIRAAERLGVHPYALLYPEELDEAQQTVLEGVCKIITYEMQPEYTVICRMYWQ